MQLKFLEYLFSVFFYVLKGINFFDGRIDGETLKSYVTDWPAQRWQEYEPLLTYCRDNAVRLIACGTPLKVESSKSYNLQSLQFDVGV